METLFAGREKELQQLMHFYEAVITQTPHSSNLVLIEGEAGAGKSSLIERFLIGLNDTSHPKALAAIASCELFSRESSFLPIFQLLDIYRNQSGYLSRISNLEKFNQIVGEVAPAWLKMLPVVGDALADTVGALRSGQEANYRRNSFAPSQQLDVDIYNEFLKLLIKLSDGRPLLLIIDDLQWADNETGHLFSYIARKLPETDHRIMLIGSYRPYDMEDSNKRLRDAFIDLEKRKQASTIRIPPFAMEDISYLLENLYKPKPIEFPTDFKRRLIAHTNGNPLFITEIMKHFEEENKIILVGDKWRFGPTADPSSELPASLQAVLEQRIERLEKRLKELLTIASVEGESFTAEILSKIKNIELVEILNTLVEDLSRNYRLVNERGEIEISLNTFASLYEFRHGLIRDYIYNNLSPVQRRLLHQQVGNCLENLYAGKSYLVAYQLANHFLIAKDYQKLAHYGVIVAQQELEKFSARQAIWWAKKVREVLKHLDQRNDNMESEALFVLIQANIHLGNYNDALSEISELELFQTLDDVQIAFCKYLRSEVITGGKIQEDPVSLLLSAGEIFKSHNKTQMAGWVLRRLAHNFAVRGDFAESESYSSEALSMLDNLQDPTSLDIKGTIWSDIAEYAIAAGDMKKAEDANQKALAIFQSIKNKRGEAIMLGNLGGLEYMYGNLAKSEALTRRSFELFREMEDAGHIVEGADNLARVMILRGKLEAAEQLLLDTEPIAIQMNEVGFLPEIYMHLAEIATLENNRDQAASYAVKAAQIVTSDDLYSAPRSYCAAAMCLLDVDQGVQAAQYMDSAVRMVEESSFNFPYVKALVYFEYARFLARTDFQVAKIAQLCKEAKEMFLHLKARRDFERVVTFEKSVQNKP